VVLLSGRKSASILAFYLSVGSADCTLFALLLLSSLKSASILTFVIIVLSEECQYSILCDQLSGLKSVSILTFVTTVIVWSEENQ
jgi:hypothetical protein